MVIGAVSTVAGILIAQFIGAQETEEAWCSFDVSLICGIMISTLFLLAAGVFPSQILGLYTKDMSIINTGAVYFRIVAFSYIPMAVSNILSSWLRCKEYATIPFLASFGAVIVNTGLNYLLIFGKLGFSCMRIKGAAIATLISQLFNLIFIVIGFSSFLLVYRINNYEKHAPRVSQVIAAVAKVSYKHGLWLVARVNKTQCEL